MYRWLIPDWHALSQTAQAGRLGLLRKLWPQLLGEGWEDLCRLSIPRLDPSTSLGALGP